MKKSLALILIAAMVFTFTACSGGLSKEQIAEAERLGQMAGCAQYESYEHIEGILVVVPTEDKPFVDVLSDAVGGLEYYTCEDAAFLAKAIVFESNGDGIDDRVYIVGDQSEKTDDGADTTKPYQALLMGGGSAVASAAPAAMSSAGSIKYLGRTEELEDKGSFVNSVKWMLAAKSLELDNWVAAQGQALTDALAAETAAKANASGEWTESTAYFNLCKTNAVYNTYQMKKGFVEYLETIIEKTEDLSESEAEEVYAQILEQNQYQYERNQLLEERAGYAINTPQLQTAAKPVLDQAAAQIEGFKKEKKNYKDTDGYLKLEAQNAALLSYENNLSVISVIDNELEAMEDAYAMETIYLRGAALKQSEAESGYALNYEAKRLDYIRAVIALEAFESANQAELTAYKDTLESIKKKYSGEDYVNDVEYMKNELAHKDLVAQEQNLEAAVTSVEEAVKKLQEEMKQKRSQYKKEIKSLEQGAAMARDNGKIRKFIESCMSDIEALVGESVPDGSKELGEISGFSIVQLGAGVVQGMDDSRDIIVHKSSGGYGGGSGGGSGGSDDGGIKYDPNDELYRENDLNNDGEINDEEFQNALGDYMDELMGY